MPPKVGINPVPFAAPTKRVVDKDPAARAMIRSWRSLTGGREVKDSDRSTLVACSGGADSSALAIALASTGARIALGHVIHDMRSAPQAESDRDAARRLAEQLGLGFEQRRVSVKSGGNVEATARRERYKALAAIAAEKGFQFVATGHHADDQLETLLMRLGRDAGLKGLSGIRERTHLAGVPVVRPALSVEHSACERICRAFGCDWAHDATNDDVSRTRARLRREVIPHLRAALPGVAIRTNELVSSVRGIDDLLRQRALCLPTCKQESSPRRVQWSRRELGHEPGLAVSAGLIAAAEFVGGGQDVKQIRRSVIEKVVTAVKDGRGGSREWRAGRIEWRVGPAGVVVRWLGDTP